MHPTKPTTPPAHLKNLIKQLKSVKRYRNYEKNIFNDNSEKHTMRCICLARSLPYLRKKFKDEIAEYLWIHDIPEVITSDFSAVQKKYNKSLAKKLKTEEVLAAKKLLSKKDFNRFIKFSFAAEILKGKRSNKIPDPNAIIAAIIDKVDGNIFFHEQLSKWVMSKSFNKKHTPPANALTFTFLTQKAIKSNLHKCKLSPNHKKTAEYLLDLQRNEVIKFWKKIPSSKIPPNVSKKLNSF